MPTFSPSSDFALTPDQAPLIEEQNAFNEKLRAAGRALPAAGSVPAEQLRQFRLYNKDGSIKPPLVPHAYTREIDALGDKRAVRVFPAKASAGLYIHFHGGGWALGSIYEQDDYLSKIAAATNLTVVSVDYPLAPAHSLPDILHVAVETTRALIREEPSASIFLGGESAGAHIALSTLIRLRTSPSVFARVNAITLLYGLYDLGMTPSQRHWGDEFLGLSTPYLEWFYAMALPGLDAEARRHPDISPLYADLKGLPPAHFIVGSLDPLLDDTLFMQARWLAAGNEAQLAIYPRAPHGFNAGDTGMAEHCNTAIHQFLLAQLEDW